jgi:O-antigen/teichoic acid export membrane protein
MTNKEQQIKNSFIYLMPVIVGTLIPIISLPIFTRILTKEDYGILALAHIYAIFLVGISNLGLINIYNRNFFHYRDTKGSSQLLYSVLLFVISTFLMCAVSTYFFKATLSKWVIGSSKHANLLFWSFCSLGVINLKTYYLSYFRNKENAKAFVWYTINDNILAFVFALFMVVYLRVGVIGLVWGPLLSSIMIFAILTVRFISFLPPSFNWRVLKFSLNLSYPLTPSIFFKVISNQFDKYMIGILASIGGVGIYSIGQRVAYFVFTCMTAIQNVFMPQVYTKMFELDKRGGEAVGHYLTPFVYICIAIALMISLFAEEVITILTPKSFHGAIDIVIILSMFYGSLFFGKQPQLIFAKKTFVNSLLIILSICLNVALNIPFIMRWGAVGAAWATLLAGLISGAISFFVAQHYYEIKWEYTKIGSIYLIFFGSTILLILLRDAGINYYIRMGIKLTSICVYIYTGMKAGVITTENFTVVRNVLVGSSFQMVKRKTT